MTIWLIIMIKCVQMPADKPPYQVSCYTTTASRGDFKTKKKCEEGMKELLKDDVIPLDAKCVSAKVWRDK